MLTIPNNLILYRKTYRSFLTLIAIVIIVVLQGCATYSKGFVNVERATANRDLDGAIKTLDALKLGGVDEALHHLNKGSLLRLKGDYTESNKQFEAAKALTERLGAISVTEQLASVSINDTSKAYEGYPDEQLMIYSFKALNYLQLNDVEAATIEARQFDIKQAYLAQNNKKAKYLAGAFERYLNGMVYEASGEPDSARIEMQKAVDGYKVQNSGFTIPQSLLDDLDRLNKGKPASSEVVFILHNGLGPSLREINSHVINPNPQNGSAYLSLSVPKFVRRSVPVAKVEISSGSFAATSEIVEDVNDIAEKSLNDRMPGIVARAVARIVVKNAAARQTKKNSNKLGNYGFLADLAVDVGTIASERADTRTWSLLPGQINMARLILPAGKHDITATYYSPNGNILATRIYKEIEVREGQKAFVSDYYMNPPQQARN